MVVELVLLLACFGVVDRPVLPTLGPALLWPDEEPPPAESACATPAAPASEVQTPTARTPVPSHDENLLCCWCA